MDTPHKRLHALFTFIVQHSYAVSLFIIFNWLCSLSVGVGYYSETTFCYEDTWCGPNSNVWGGQCKTGSKQSPINLPYVSNPIVPRVPLDFNEYYFNDEFWIIDNGHTIRVALSQGQQRSKAKMSGYGLRSSYIFAEIHFHWGYNSSTGSEHSVNKKFYAMEAHLVHFDSKYSNLTAAVQSGDPSALAVLGIFIAEGTECHSHSIGGLDTIAANIPKSSGSETHVQEKINLSSFLPKRRQAFYRYYGSLTTPDCNESVVWTVLRTPIYVKPSLIQKFRNLTHIGANYRPIQKLGRRTVNYLAKK